LRRHSAKAAYSSNKNYHRTHPHDLILSQHSRELQSQESQMLIAC
jgi:hypothetical protein